MVVIFDNIVVIDITFVTFIMDIVGCDFHKYNTSSYPEWTSFVDRAAVMIFVGSIDKSPIGFFFWIMIYL